MGKPRKTCCTLKRFKKGYKVACSACGHWYHCATKPIALATREFHNDRRCLMREVPIKDPWEAISLLSRVLDARLADLRPERTSTTYPHDGDYRSVGDQLFEIHQAIYEVAKSLQNIASAFDDFNTNIRNYPIHIVKGTP